MQRRADHDLPALGYRVRGIAHEIEQRELQLARVQLRRQRLLSQFGPQRHPVARDMRKHPIEFADHRVHIDHLARGTLMAHEREHLLCQPRRLAGAPFRAFELLHPALVQLLSPQLVEAGKHNRQHVVELMRHAGGNRAQQSRPLGAQGSKLRGGIRRLVLLRAIGQKRTPALARDHVITTPF